MTVYATDIYQRSARIIGWRTGTVASVTPVVVDGVNYYDVVLNGLVDTTGDDSFYAGDRLIFISSSHGTVQSFITLWTDTTGTARILQSAGTVLANQTYILVPRQDYTLNEVQYAFEKTLNQTPRTYRQVVPFAPLLRDYYLTQCDWLTGSGDIDAVYITLSPLMLHNEDFSLWQDGVAAVPDGYSLTGTGASVARVSGGIRSGYAAQLTAGGGTLRMTQSIPANLAQWITRRSYPVFTPMRAAAWVSTTDASSVRIFIYDGGSYHYSDYISADGVPQFPTLSLTPDADMTEFTWGVEVGAGDSCILSWAGLMQNTSTFDIAYSLHDSGSQAIPYVEMPYTHTIRNVGGVPMVELQPYPTTWGQLIVYVRRPFPAYSSDADSFDDQYARVLTAGLCNFLLEAVKPEQDRSRYDRIRREQASIWTRMASQITDVPVPAPPVRYDVVGV